MTTPQAIEELSFDDWNLLGEKIWDLIWPIGDQMSAHEIRDREKHVKSEANVITYRLRVLPSWAIDDIAEHYGVGLQRETTVALGAPPSAQIVEAIA